MIETDKRTCGVCYWRGTSDQILVAQNPFDPGDTVTGCPKCLSVDSTTIVCDEPGCWKEVTCGTPIPDGSYRQTCGTHRQPINQ